MENKPIIIKYNGKSYWGFKSPVPRWLKLRFIDAVDGKCEDCGATKRLEIHRPKRQIENGLYMVVPKNHYLSNCKVLCSECHKKYNYSRKLPSFTI